MALEKGIISERYGLIKNKYVTGVETKNNGLNFHTEPGQFRVVFDGKISRIFYIKGIGKAVLVNHGEYFTVYSGLKNILVTTGDRVLSKQKIGTVITSESESITELHFEIWKEKILKTHLNGCTELNNLKLYKFIKIKIMNSTLLVGYRTLADCFNCFGGFVNVWRKENSRIDEGTRKRFERV